MERERIRVTEGVVVARLRRSLLARGKYLRVATSRKQKRWGLGRYYLLDAKGVVHKDLDIEKLARKLGLLHSWETLEK
jgi:hypothetical protein